ncbi:anthranilate synthase component I [Halobium salinum]|uniref:Anthranilate synthase component 1 n=1 Tax=Halobium salinum TaxID=1364940 RepID=A0ABD5P8U7_9EURY|nr:anthranilate synthase component I [Halobium salinum]
MTDGADTDGSVGSDTSAGAGAGASEAPLDTTREAFVEGVERVDGPAVVHLAADLDLDVAPLAAYTALADRSDYGFLLESAEKVASSDPDGAFAPSPSPAGVDTREDASGGADRHARFSFVGYDPEAVVSVGADGANVESLGGRAADLVREGVERVDDDGGDTLDRLRGALPDVTRVGFPDTERRHLDGGLVGFLAYDAVYDLWLDEVGVERGATDSELPDGDGSELPSADLPDAEFVLTTRTLVFDDEADSASLVFTPVVRPADDPDAVYDELLAEVDRVSTTLAAAEEPDPGEFVKTGETAGSREAYEDAVRRAKEHVLDGDVYQAVISRTRELRGEIDPVGLYAALRAVNPSPYMYLLRHGDRSVVGASPETLVSVEGDRVVSNPIAGTCPRGSSPVEDRRLAGEMLADAKERAEHTMLVDLARNDVRRVSEAGSVRVEEFMNVLKYSHVQHIESTVTGRLAADRDAFDAVRVSFPAGTLTGAPKVRAMELVDELEETPRGVYGGGVGYFSWHGDADLAIVIRTATVDESGDEDRVTVRAGAGIVADSDPGAEYEETEKKMGGVLAALERIERSDAGGAGLDHGETAPEASR